MNKKMSHKEAVTAEVRTLFKWGLSVVRFNKQYTFLFLAVLFILVSDYLMPGTLFLAFGAVFLFTLFYKIGPNPKFLLYSFFLVGPLLLTVFLDLSIAEMMSIQFWRSLMVARVAVGVLGIISLFLITQYIVTSREYKKGLRILEGAFAVVFFSLVIFMSEPLAAFNDLKQGLTKYLGTCHIESTFTNIPGAGGRMRYFLYISGENSERYKISSDLYLDLSKPQSFVETVSVHKCSREVEVYYLQHSRFVFENKEELKQ